MQYCNHQTDRFFDTQLSRVGPSELRNCDYILLQARQLRRVESEIKIFPETTVNPVTTGGSGLFTLVEAMNTFTADQDSGLFEIMLDQSTRPDKQNRFVSLRKHKTIIDDTEIVFILVRDMTDDRKFKETLKKQKRDQIRQALLSVDFGNSIRNLTLLV